MRISSNNLRQIIMEEYNRAQRMNRLHEGTQYNPIQLDAKALRNIILEESYNNLNERRLNESRSVRVTPQMLRQMILEESRRYR
jgi:hypothetical protein